jgi:hypothetical protein
MTAQGEHQDWMLGALSSQASSSQSHTNAIAHPVPQRHRPPLILTMANRGYDVVVDVDTEVKTLAFAAADSNADERLLKG